MEAGSVDFRKVPRVPHAKGGWGSGTEKFTGVHFMFNGEYWVEELNLMGWQGFTGLVWLMNHAFL